MRKVLLAVVVCAALESSAFGACTTDACRNAVAWKNGFTAVLLDENVSSTRYLALLDVLKAQGSTVAIETDDVLLGWVPPAAAAQLRKEPGVKAVFFGPVPNHASLARGVNGLAALRFFHRVVTGEWDDEVERGLGVRAEPITGCTLVTRDYAAYRFGTPVADASGTSSQAPADIHNEAHAVPHIHDESGRVTTNEATTPVPQHGEPVRRIPRAAPEWDYVAPHRNPDMRGRVTVQVFRLDSNGVANPDEFSWTYDRIQQADEQVMGAFTEWVNQATSRGVTLSFRVKFINYVGHYGRIIKTTYVDWEPIRRPYEEHYLFVNQALQKVGYGASPPVTQANVYNRNEEYNLSMLYDPYYGTFDRSFTIFIAYNPPELGAPATFPNDNRGYAHPDGPHTMVMWNSAGWMPENLGNVVAHETGHIFWACDEYSGGCDTCDLCWFAGPRNRYDTPSIKNDNCQSARNPYYGTIYACASYACRMNNLLSTGLCPSTPAQIGW